MWRVAVTVEGRTRAPAPSIVQDRLRACLLAQEACSWRLRSPKRWILPCPTISTHLRPILAVLAGGGHPHIMQTRCCRCRGNARSPSPVASISTWVEVTRSVIIKGRDDQLGPLFPRRPRHRAQEVARDLPSAKGGHAAGQEPRRSSAVNGQPPADLSCRTYSAITKRNLLPPRNLLCRQV
jgi:hypothetical protein